MLRFADAPTAAIAVVPTRPVHVVRPEPRPVPEDFSEQVALTSPIALPRHPHAEREASKHDVARHLPSHHEPRHPPTAADPSRRAVRDAG